MFFPQACVRLCCVFVCVVFMIVVGWFMSPVFLWFVVLVVRLCCLPLFVYVVCCCVLCVVFLVVVFGC